MSSLDDAVAEAEAADKIREEAKARLIAALDAYDAEERKLPEWEAYCQASYDSYLKGHESIPHQKHVRDAWANAVNASPEASTALKAWKDAISVQGAAFDNANQAWQRVKTYLPDALLKRFHDNGGHL